VDRFSNLFHREIPKNALLHCVEKLSNSKYTVYATNDLIVSSSNVNQLQVRNVEMYVRDVLSHLQRTRGGTPIRVGDADTIGTLLVPWAGHFR